MSSETRFATLGAPSTYNKDASIAEDDDDHDQPGRYIRANAIRYWTHLNVHVDPTMYDNNKLYNSLYTYHLSAPFYPI